VALTPLVKERRVPESLEEMLEDQEIIRLSKRLALRGAASYTSHGTLLLLLLLLPGLLLLLDLLLKLPHSRPCPCQHHRDPPQQELMT
jgi:hypothetical protein